jgi:CRP-like cAMP-binding protein
MYRHKQITNRMLLSLPQATVRRLLPAFEWVETRRGDVIDHVTGPVRHLYFINRGMVSLVKAMHDGRTVEVGVVGPEGITDCNALFVSDRAVLDAMVQIPGSAVRISLPAMREIMTADAALQRMMARYSGFAIGQLAQTAACNRLHSLEERCCRWLLTAEDAALSCTFPLTQEFFAMMLGVQRSGVSLTAARLRNNGVVSYLRGKVTILDRAALEESACECYAERRSEIDRLFDMKN